MRNIFQRLARAFVRTGWSARQSEEESELRRIILSSGLFDPAYYLRQYPDVAAAKMDPVIHYIRYGEFEGRNPSAKSDARDRLTKYIDARAASQNAPSHSAPRFRTARIENPALRDLIEFRPEALEPPSLTYNPESLEIHWVTPEIAAGGGGLRAIFIMTRWLEIFGHECTIWVHHANPKISQEERVCNVIRNYPLVRAKVYPLNDKFFQARGDVILATAWQTVAPVLQAKNFKERFYYVQDYEPLFYPMGSMALAAEMTYTKDLACICASPWLGKLMAEKYGKKWVRHFYSSHDPLIYNSDETTHKRPKDNDRPPRIAFYSHFTSPRRVVELGLLALEVLSKRSVRFHVDFFGNRHPFSNVPYPHTDHGVLDFERLADLYRSADIGICFSSTNYGGVPKEMMACRLPILELDVESTRSVYPDDAVSFCPPDPIAIADRIEALLTNPEKRKEQAERAYRWASGFSWEKSTRTVESALLDRLTEKNFQPVNHTKAVGTGSRGRPKASVLIPTFNGGQVFRDVLDRVRKQRTPWPFEIVVIDSTSTDGTAELCQASSDIRFMQIPQSEFAHGPTRNHGISRCEGEYVVLLTQDAMPANEFWLYNMVTTMEHFPDAAGAFGRHLAYSDASPFTKRDIALQFARYDREHPVAATLGSDATKSPAQDQRWIQMLHFYSNNSSCMRRSVWEKSPFPDVGYGEDQLWAMEILKRGYQKVYARSSIVYHSHNHSPDEIRKRAVIAAAWRKKHFGYVAVTDEQSLEQRLAKLCKADRKWAEENNIPAAEVEIQMQRNEARLRGELDGYLAVIKREKWVDNL